MTTKLRRLMDERNMTVRDLARHTGLSARSIEQYSTGRYPLRNARGYMLVAIADALEIHPRELIEPENADSPSPD